MIEKFNRSQFLMNPEIKMSESVSGTLQYVYLGYKTALLIKFINSEKATKFCEIFTLLLTGTTGYLIAKSDK